MQLLGLVAVASWIYTLYHCYNNTQFDSGRRVIWFFAILLFSPISTIVYWVVHCLQR